MGHHPFPLSTKSHRRNSQQQRRQNLNNSFRGLHFISPANSGSHAILAMLPRWSFDVSRRAPAILHGAGMVRLAPYFGNRKVRPTLAVHFAVGPAFGFGVFIVVIQVQMS